jgi:hypothetical protein
MEAASVVNPSTGDLFELEGFKLLAFDGTIRHDGALSELPYQFSFPGAYTKVLWNWASNLESAHARCTDITVPYNASLNDITDGGNFNNNAALPRKLFNDTAFTRCTDSRWIAKNNTSQWVQYQFLDGPRIVTGCRLVPCQEHPKRAPNAFQLLGSNDGAEWETLLEVAGMGTALPALSASSRFHFENERQFSYYRLLFTGGGDTYFELTQVELYTIYGSDTLRIVGSPQSFGGVAPGYGCHYGLGDGDVLTYTAPAHVDVDASTRVSCAGHSISINYAPPVKNVSGTATYTHHAGDFARIVWLWAPEYRQEIAITGEGSVNRETFWAAEGETVSVTAAATSPDHPFLRWTGDVPEGQENNTSLTYVIDGPRSLVAVFGSPVYVKTDGDDTADGSSWANAVATPERALAIVPEGGTIIVRAGTYAVQGGALAIEKYATLSSESGPVQTVFEAVSGSDGPLFVCSNEYAQVNGFSFRGGTASDGLAGGVRIYSGSVTNCVIDSCSSTAASSHGGGVFIDEEVKGLFGCVVTNCYSAGPGGGVYMLGGAVVGCVIAGNSGTGGGGVYISGTISPVFENCVVHGNVARSGNGGGASVLRATHVKGCTFAFNKTSGNYGSGIYLSGGSIADSVIQGNSGASRGGGIYTSTAPISRCSVIGNSCTYFAGGVFTDTSRIDNCLIVANTNTSTSAATGGGGTFSRDGAEIVNCTYVGNAAYRAASAWVDAAFEMRNCVIADGHSLGRGNVVTNVGGNAASKTEAQQKTTRHSCVHDTVFVPYAGTRTVVADPKLDRQYAPRFSSPCVNAGSNAYVAGDQTDLYGRPRIRLFGGKAKYDVVDMGCYETDFMGADAATRLFLK